MSINKPETTEKFNALLEKYCPETHSRQRKHPDTPENIEASAHELMNNIGSLVLEASQGIGAVSNRLNLMKDAVENHDWEFIRKETARISQIPMAVPQPSCLKYSDMNVVYLWREGKELKSIPPRTKLEIVPDVCRITMDGVSLEEVKAYQQELTQIKELKVWDKAEDGKFTLFCRSENSYFAVIWENERARIIMTDNYVCFVPTMYLPVVTSMILEERQQPHY